MLATNYKRLGDSRRGDQYDKLALHSAWLARHDDPGWGELLQAEKYSDQKQYALAIRQFRRFINTRNGQHNRENVANALLNMAWCFEKAGQPAQARQVVEATIRAARQDKQLTAEAEAYGLLARLWQQLGQPANSLRAARMSVHLVWQSGTVTLRPQALQTLADAEERTGQYRAALQTARRQRQVTDSLNALNRADALAVIQTTFDVEQKNLQIERLNQTLTIRELEKQQQLQLSRTIIGSLFVGIALTVFFLRRSYRQNRKIERQAAQLTDLIRVKDQLFSIVSHDLRGPVMSMKQSLDLVDTVDAETLSRFRQSAGGLAVLVDNVLYWALNQQGGLRTRPHLFDLRETITEVLNLYRESIRQKNLHVVLNYSTLASDGQLVEADDYQTEIVLRNIVQNAIWFSPVGGRITLHLTRANRQTMLVLTDEGPGFDWQPGQAILNKTGTGLGLTVAATLMQHNGGLIELTKRTDGPGTLARLGWPVVADLRVKTSRSENR